MNSSNYKLSLDVQQACSPVVLEAKQGDTKRELWVTLTDGDALYSITEECYAVFTAAKSDGTFIANPCRILGNTIVYDLTPQTLAAAGYCDCEIRLYGADDGLLTSARFGLLVHEPALGEEDVIRSETEVDALTQLIGDAAQVIRESEVQNLESRVLIGELELHRQDFEQKAADARADAKAAELSAQVAESSAREAGLSQQAAALSEQGAQFHRQAAEDASDEAQLALQMAKQSQSGAEYWAGQAKKHAQEAAQYAGSGSDISLSAVDQRIEDAIREHNENDDQCHPDIRSHLDALDQRFGDLEQLETEDKSSLVAAVNEVLGKAGTGGSGGNADHSGLTAEQISALDGMFKIAAYTADAKNAYKAFQTAFGIGGEVEPDGPDVPVVPDEPDEPIDTSVKIAKTGYGFNTSATEEVSNSSLSISEYYDVPDGYTGKVSYFFPNNGTSGIGSYMKMQMVNDSNEKVEYWSMSVGTAEKTVNFYHAKATKFRFALETATADDSYMYYTGTGDIVFAGKNTKYYGMRNISEYTGA